MSNRDSKPLKPWQHRIHEIIFEADTFEGKLFDVALLIAIIASVLVVMLDSVDWISREYGTTLDVLEWIFTIIFTLEYVARILVIGKPWKYIFSFFGIVDLLSILPTYINIFVSGPQYLMVIRTFRLLRVFRVLKLARFLREADTLISALRASRAKITVFLVAVLSIVIIMGTLMYLIEAGSNEKFTSIPRSVYWAIVTMTTVGYGDIAPTTAFGQFIAAIIMILGYGVIAVPTGIVGSEFVQAKSQSKEVSTQACPQCSSEGHDPDAEFCKYCGAEL